MNVIVVNSAGEAVIRTETHLFNARKGTSTSVLFPNAVTIPLRRKHSA